MHMRLAKLLRDGGDTEDDWGEARFKEETVAPFWRVPASPGKSGAFRLLQEMSALLAVVCTFVASAALLRWFAGEAFWEPPSLLAFFFPVVSIGLVAAALLALAAEALSRLLPTKRFRVYVGADPPIDIRGNLRRI